MFLPLMHAQGITEKGNMDIKEVAKEVEARGPKGQVHEMAGLQQRENGECVLPTFSKQRIYYPRLKKTISVYKEAFLATFFLDSAVVSFL